MNRTTYRHTFDSENYRDLDDYAQFLWPENIEMLMICALIARERLRELGEPLDGEPIADCDILVRSLFDALSDSWRVLWYAPDYRAKLTRCADEFDHVMHTGVEYPVDNTDRAWQVAKVRREMAETIDRLQARLAYLGEAQRALEREIRPDVDDDDDPGGLGVDPEL
jgi:hypothetical protein